ncbi:MAG: ATP-dependent helicase YejH, partial [Myxococcaceae bacterium]|nr:ATP-dependent helicase YejH [Myxococcaceae bacterium]
VFDYAALAKELGRRPRLLFLAHRRELLRQAAHTYRRLLHASKDPATVGWFVESENDLNEDLVFASISKLARPEYLARLGTQHFDYVVVDEVHHAAAASYRRVLDVLTPGFLLGLTATPDRADAADVLGLFDDHVAFRADVGAGIELGRLVPFHYHGVKDDINYDNLPWRNRRFDPAALAVAVQTERRMQTLWRVWNEHPGERTLVFCSSISHALFAKTWLLARGIRAKAVFADEGSDDRDEALEELAAGQLDALCAVDLFNEGIDLPALDRVVMLRPTESGIVFLQQLGRGLRASPGKSSLTIIDFVGNHRVFLERFRKLLSLTRDDSARELARLLESDGTLELPGGCSVELELEAKELLARLFRVGGTDQVERVYRELKREREQRPSAGELLRMDYNPRTLRARHGSWFEFVRNEGDLDESARAALDLSPSWFEELEKTSMTKSFKMVTLEVLLEHDALLEGLSLRDLALGAHAYLLRSPELWKDVSNAERFQNLNTANEAAWVSYWRENPVNAWVSGSKERRAWFRLESDRFSLNLTVESAFASAWLELTRELVDYRLAQYRRREASGVVPDGFTCSVISNQRDPILKLPSGKGHSPPREVDVRLPDGSVWQFRFAKEFINVARPPGEPVNRLPDLLRRWFGPSAGRPGTTFRVRFSASPDGLWVEPVRAPVAEAAPLLRGIVTYPDLRAAAGHVRDATDSQDGRSSVLLPGVAEDPELFAVRVVGSSMDGGRQPIRDGDWAVLRWARGAGPESLLNRVVLVQTASETFGTQHQLKRLARRASKWLLTSDNPEGPTIEPDEDMYVMARLERTVRPEELAPAVGSVVASEQLAETFQIDALAPSSGRHGGHLFIFIDRADLLQAPNSVRYAAAQRKPSETAYVLAKEEQSYRYLGVGRWDEATNLWRIPEVNYGTWRAWGAGKEVSRQVPDGLLSRADAVADSALAQGEGERVVAQADGRRARIVGRAALGGVRVTGVEGAFAERTISLIDLAWVLAAKDDVKANGGLLDEQRVNRLRYLEGTPKGATRWIDTGWAIAIVTSVLGL